MGSSSSVSRPPTEQRTRLSIAPSRSRSTGFREIQLQHQESAQGAGRTSASVSQRQKSNKTPKNKSHHNSHHSMEENGDFVDLSMVAGQLQREQTKFDISEDDQPKYNKDDMVLETFYHQNGSTYSCLYQGGERLYLDSFQSQDWHPFPQEWYRQGVLVTDRFIKDEDLNLDSAPSSPTREQRPAQSRAAAYEQTDDRASFINHPTRGKLQTYVFEEKHNVHYYFDRNVGRWIPLPISWELHSDIVQKLMTHIQEVLPDWKDQHDMLAALRSTNYDPQECVATYLTIGDYDSLKIPKNSADAKLLQEKDEEIKELKNKVQHLEHQLDKYNRQVEQEVRDRKIAEKQVKELQDQVSSLEVAVATANARMEAMQLERPKTARPPSARPRTPAKTPEPINQVDPDTVIALNKCSSQLHKVHIKFRMEIKQKMAELEQLMKQLMIGIMKIRLFDNSQTAELQELKELYHRESVQRKLLYNKLLELRGNIRVFCRCRYDDRTSCCLQFPSDHEVLPPGVKKSLKFDKVFTPQSTQEEVFEEARPIITSCVDGYNVCILAYGQTGSGKTYTMQGPAENPGVNVRAMKELLSICQEKENVDYTLKASMVEIYNECIQDLLSPDTKTLDIRTKGHKISIPGIVEMDVESLTDIDKIIKLGEKNRSTAATKMNSQSSRSHLIFMITVQGRDRTSESVSVGTLTLCDLAGSERVAKTEAQGQRLVEAAAINKSLSSLGQVFTALRTGQLHIPYRNSKLTHILQPSLGGDAKACLFAMVSPDEDNLPETMSTLQFGSNARQVALGQAKQNIKKLPQGT